ncbi:uncharacterized protein EV420DRAFT_1593439 [Desarmillaria tabescens]|uniref:Uncharacterized protein n=1 Tax=Armillaria tabescens TaxID=1929756 RepID=A0AA39J4K6_ARMTA|nr:uncharacterized protein EV420DRAFT_1593439 [Desarmillaria tabescens]KAK0435345.1 hypothetical protein EV420DRAFT_1593439 [Desarmillaria tabescens]
MLHISLLPFSCSYIFFLKKLSFSWPLYVIFYSVIIESSPSSPQSSWLIHLPFIRLLCHLVFEPYLSLHPRF